VRSGELSDRYGRRTAPRSRVAAHRRVEPGARGL